MSISLAKCSKNALYLPSNIADRNRTPYCIKMIRTSANIYIRY